MRNPVRSSQFKRDVKLAERRGKDMRKLRALVVLLIEAKRLPAEYQDHPLKGDWKACRDVHLEPDWLLIYKADDATVWLVRTGTHADIFGT